MRQKVFVLGATGSVGTELLHQITQKDGIESNVNPTDIIGIANSTTVLVSETALNDTIVGERSEIKTRVTNLLQQEGKAYTSMTEILESLSAAGYSGEVIIVDVTAAKGEQIRRFHLDALSRDFEFSVVTANKNVASLEEQ